MDVPTVVAEFRWRGDAEMAAAHLAEAYGCEDLEVRMTGPEDRNATRMAWGESGPADTALLVARTDAGELARQIAGVLWRAGALEVHVTATP